VSYERFAEQNVIWPADNRLEVFSGTLLAAEYGVDIYCPGIEFDAWESYRKTPTVEFPAKDYLDLYGGAPRDELLIG
jgi:hypothetical protein